MSLALILGGLAGAGCFASFVERFYRQHRRRQLIPHRPVIFGRSADENRS